MSERPRADGDREPLHASGPGDRSHPGRQGRRHRHRDGERQDPLLQHPGARDDREPPGRAGPLPLSRRRRSRRISSARCGGSSARTRRRRIGRRGSRAGGGFDFHAGTYDGDTPAALRTQLRERARILLTNPDMLHSGILPNHARWAEFFGRLSYVVADEIHVYRGIFGSHTANVLRRLPADRRALRRAAAADLLLGDDRQSGRAGRAADRPPVRDGRRGRLAARAQALRLLESAADRQRRGSSGSRRTSRRATSCVSLLRGGYQVIAFVRARLLTEVLLRYCQEELRRDGGGLAKKIRAYRGRLPARGAAGDRARALRGRAARRRSRRTPSSSGSTSAASTRRSSSASPARSPRTWQQAGRAGRREDESVAVLVGHNLPIDQYLMRHPEYFFERTPEHAVDRPAEPAHPPLAPALRGLRAAAAPAGGAEVGGSTRRRSSTSSPSTARSKEVKGRWYYAKEGLSRGGGLAAQRGRERLHDHRDQAVPTATG